MNAIGSRLEPGTLPSDVYVAFKLTARRLSDHDLLHLPRFWPRGGAAGPDVSVRICDIRCRGSRDTAGRHGHGRATVTGIRAGRGSTVVNGRSEKYRYGLRCPVRPGVTAPAPARPCDM